MDYFRLQKGTDKKTFKQQQGCWLCSATASRGTFTRPLANLDSHEQLLTDKMTENNFNFGRKWQTKNLCMSEKSSTFAPDLENNKFNPIKNKHYD